jgi:hypothetical protein
MSSSWRAANARRTLWFCATAIPDEWMQIFLNDIPFGDQARQKILGLTAKKLWFPESVLTLDGARPP